MKQILQIWIPVLVFLLVSAVVVVTSPAFEKCRQPPKCTDCQQSATKDPSPVPSHYVCFVNSLQANSGTITFMATILVVIFTALLWGATDRLAAATDALYRAADSQEKTAQTHERAYLVAGPLFGVPKCDIDEWAMKHRAQATMFKGPWRMTIQNFGRTAAYAIEIVWGFCPEDEFRKVDERIKDSKRKVSELLDRPDFEQWRKAYIENSIDGQFIISPTEHTPYQFRHVVVEDRDKYLDHVFFGRVKYLDVFRKCYYTTFSYLLKKESTDPIGNSFVYDQGECEQKR